MTIVRANRPNQYVQIDNRVARDHRLSLRARGLLLELLSHADGWRWGSADDIAENQPEGRDAIRTALRELESVGYLVRRKVQDKVTGRWSTECLLSETPEGGFSGPGAPAAGSPAAGNPPVGEPGAIDQNTTQNTKEEQGQPLPSAAPPGAQLALIDPPVVGELVERPEENGGTIVRAWCDWMGDQGDAKLPGPIIARFGKAIKEALAEGFPPELIKRARVAMTRDRVASRPSMFATYIVRVQQGPELMPERLGRVASQIVRSGTGIDPAFLEGFAPRRKVVTA